MGHRYVSLQQALAADKQLWTLIAPETRNKLQIEAGSAPPLDVAIEKYAAHPAVKACMTPLPVAPPSQAVNTNKQPIQKHENSKQFVADRPSSPSPKGSGKGKSNSFNIEQM